MGGWLAPRVACCALALASCCGAAEDLLLVRIRQKMAETLRHMPDYTCVQTLERWREGDPCAHCRYWERLRLEVALIGGKERFAWPGAQQFEEKDIDQILPPGATATGDFSGFATAVFATDAPIFEGPVAETLDGRPSWRYNYHVPASRSRYTIRDGRHRAVVPYHGAFWVDRDTLELLRLDIEADGLPAPPLEVTSARTAIQYGRVRIGESSFLLPRISELNLTSLSVRASRNRTTFGQCRQYVGHSAVRFDEAAPVEVLAVPDPERFRLPPGLTLELRLETTVDPAVSAAGDPLEATVVRDVRREGVLLVPKGARVEGRLRTLRQHLAPRSIGVIALEFDRIRTPGRESLFRARLELLGGIVPGIRRQSDVVVSVVGEESAILFNGPLARLPRGLRMQWRTIP